MRNLTRTTPWILRSIALSTAFTAAIVVAQPQPATSAQPAAQARRDQIAQPPAPITPASEKDVAITQQELIRLLRMSPTLTTVISHDPSLLSNQEYVAHNNPQLAQFLAAHPEIARNPDFYLFTHLHTDGEPDEALERAVWPDVYRETTRPGPFNEFLRDLSPLLAFLGSLVALLWMIRVVLENRRWGRIFKLQSEVHSRLIDKFSTNQELALYMDSDAGKRFLEAAPIPVSFETEQRMPNAVARVLTPLQIGIVLLLLGVGMLLIRHTSADMEIPMLVLGTVVLMPGAGFIISAGITWVLAGRLGLMPDKSAAPFKTGDRQ
jgi:hypothetical protein